MDTFIHIKNMVCNRCIATVLLEFNVLEFNDVLDIQELQLKFQMNQIESMKAYYLQSTIINYLTN